MANLVKLLSSNNPSFSLVNGVAHLVSATPPAIRPGGTSLVDGDRWYNPNTGTEAFRKGIYWLSSEVGYTSGRRSSGLVSPNHTEATEFNYPSGRQTFLVEANYACTLATAGNSSNYYAFVINATLRNNNSILLYTSPTKLFANGENSVSSELINLVVSANYAGGRVIGLLGGFTVVGSPPSISNICHSIGWRLIL